MGLLCVCQPRPHLPLHALDPLEVPSLPRAVYRHVGLLLLVQLAAVYQFLERTAPQQAVHVYITMLAEPEGTVLGLEVVSGVPRRVEDNHAVSGREIEPQTACTGVTVGRGCKGEKTLSGNECAWSLP